jgi:predicted nucleotidyltransferase
MNSQAILRDIVKRIRKEVRPQKIVLFGSRARGQARPNSDYDILIVKRTRSPMHSRMVRAYSALSGLPVPIDIVVYTPAEVRDWSNVRQALVTTAIREGKVLYEERP